MKTTEDFDAMSFEKRGCSDAIENDEVYCLMQNIIERQRLPKWFKMKN